LVVSLLCTEGGRESFFSLSPLTDKLRKAKQKKIGEDNRQLTVVASAPIRWWERRSAVPTGSWESMTHEVIELNVIILLSLVAQLSLYLLC
jgi:hypothetical protein